MFLCIAFSCMPLAFRELVRSRWRPGFACLDGMHFCRFCERRSGVLGASRTLAPGLSLCVAPCFLSFICTFILSRCIDVHYFVCIFFWPWAFVTFLYSCLDDVSMYKDHFHCYHVFTSLSFSFLAIQKKKNPGRYSWYQSLGSSLLGFHLPHLCLEQYKLS
jgi:hypothetical protein